MPELQGLLMKHDFRDASMRRICYGLQVTHYTLAVFAASTGIYTWENLVQPGRFRVYHLYLGIASATPPACRSSPSEHLFTNYEMET